jgi:hypothetical protein
MRLKHNSLNRTEKRREEKKSKKAPFRAVVLTSGLLLILPSFANAKDRCIAQKKSGDPATLAATEGSTKAPKSLTLNVLSPEGYVQINISGNYPKRLFKMAEMLVEPERSGFLRAAILANIEKGVGRVGTSKKRRYFQCVPLMGVKPELPKLALVAPPKEKPKTKPKTDPLPPPRSKKEIKPEAPTPKPEPKPEPKPQPKKEPEALASKDKKTEEKTPAKKDKEPEAPPTKESAKDKTPPPITEAAKKEPKKKRRVIASLTPEPKKEEPAVPSPLPIRLEGGKGTDTDPFRFRIPVPVARKAEVGTILFSNEGNPTRMLGVGGRSYYYRFTFVGVVKEENSPITTRAKLTSVLANRMASAINRSLPREKRATGRISATVTKGPAKSIVNLATGKNASIKGYFSD